MQPAIFATEWIHDEDEPGNPLLGLMLGYAHHPHHRNGVSPILHQLGIPEQLKTMADIVVKIVPNELMLQEFALPRIDRRHKERYGLLLTMVNPARMPSLSLEPIERARSLGVLCTVPKGVRNHEQLLCSWDETGFAICATGQDNVRNLRILHEAFTEKNVSVVRPFVQGLTQGSLGFCLQDRMAKALEQAAGIIRTKQANARHEVSRSGIVRKLIEAGFKIRIAEPCFEKTLGAAMVWVGPDIADEDRLNSGWFLIPELEQALKGQGPLFKVADEQAAERAQPVLHSLVEQGISFVRSPHIYEQDGELHVALYAKPMAGGPLKTGHYLLEELEAFAGKQAMLEAA